MVQHRGIGRLVGLTDQQITAVQMSNLDRACFSPKEKLVLAFADEVIAGPHVSNSLFEAIRTVLTPREIVELLLVIGWYWTACRLTTALEIAPEHPLGQRIISMLELAHAG